MKTLIKRAVLFAYSNHIIGWRTAQRIIDVTRSNQS